MNKCKNCGRKIKDARWLCDHCANGNCPGDKAYEIFY